MHDLSVDYSLSHDEREYMCDIFEGIKENPYKDYKAFEFAVMKIIGGRDVFLPFRRFCDEKKSADTYEEPYVFIKNCPLDKDLPYLDFDDPVADKRNRKKHS